MKNILSRILMLAVFVLLASNSAWAIIDKVEFRRLTFPAGNVVRMPQSCSDCELKVTGFGVDFANRIEVSSSSGIDVSGITEKKGGNGSFIKFKLTIEDDAAASERTVTIKYPLGQDTFKIRVIRVGTISKIEYKRPTTTSPRGIGDFARSVSTNVENLSNLRATPISINNLPEDTTVRLVITGTKLSNTKAEFEREGNSPANDMQVLPGGSNTSFEVEGKFRVPGIYKLSVADGDDPNRRFDYVGASSSDDLKVTVIALPPAPITKDDTPCVSDPSPPLVPKTSPENTSTVTIDNGTNRARITFRWSLGNLAPNEQRDKIIFTLQEGNGVVQRTELNPGTTERSVDLTRGRTYRWNVFTLNCGVTPSAADPNFQPFTITVNN